MIFIKVTVMTHTQTNPLVLASSSPRRRELLREAGYQFVVVEPPIPEPDDLVPHLDPAQQAEALAYFKARSVFDDCGDRCVLGADTVVACGPAILGKPTDEADARRMLSMLSGSRHRVITGVALLTPGRTRMIASETSWVVMRPISPAEIDQYIASQEWQGKAGAYAIQETADRFVQKVEGSFTNIVGLPLELVERMFEELQEHPESHRLGPP